MNSIKPLKFPKIKKTKSLFEKFWNYFSDSHNKQIFEDIVHQLNQRSKQSQKIWNNHLSIEKDVAIKLSRILKKHLGWPNSYFIPNDPAEVVFWDRYGDLDLVEAIIEIEQSFEIEKNDQYWQSIGKKTFLNIVKDIINKKI